MSFPKILFSIIVPVFNVEKYLVECIESLIHQKIDNYEIILIDDGSTDSSGSICDRYQDIPKLTVIHQENSGVSIARKNGIAIAKGEYIICVDGDDYVSSELIFDLTEIIDRCKPDIIHYGAIRFDKENIFNKNNVVTEDVLYNKQKIEEKIFPNLVQGQDASYFCSSIWRNAIKKELIEKYLVVHKAANMGEDFATLVPCIYHAQSIYLSKQCYYFYRINMLSVTNNKKPMNWKWPLIVNKHIMDNIDTSQFDFIDQINRKITHDVFNVAVSQFYSNDSYNHICNDIRGLLEQNFYDKAINNCCFSRSIKGTIMKTALKYRCCFLLYLYSRMK